MRPCPARLLLALALAAAPVLAAAAPATSDEAELRRLTQENLDAIAPGRVEVWQRNAHERLLHTDENGQVRSKAELLAEFRPLPPGLSGRLAVDRFSAVVLGDTALVSHEDLETLDYHGQTLVSRWRNTDTWLRTDAGWKLIGAQVLALQNDPPAAAPATVRLCDYNGRYRLADAIEATLQCDGDALVAQREGRPPSRYRAELADVFFLPGQPRTRRIFQRDATGAIVGFVDRREGLDIRWMRVK
ncbi:nuclear transport factor 2 family protein [Lysobacter silvisoli]|uniref:Nuclear transport factor 2 family protein n=1 Tax=Lysobacter silvisoli TaxID=2293254 RepID=A0A371K601_9GAMM|nr:nuclear transport factor 2 family protein [Lysobacter silvisoli]RDZ29282.1 nuclear transport factor 2 family protein [Lysobacter silvisoli]